MGLSEYVERNSWIQSAVMISMVVLFILVAVILIQYSHQRSINEKNMESRCNEISTSIVGGMTNALSIGDNDIVREQFKKLHEVLPEIDVFVYDYQSKISFSTEPEFIGKSFNDFLGEPGNIEQNQVMLKTGTSGGLIKKRVDDKLYYGSLMPSRNEKTCHHCHGSSRLIIGGLQEEGF